MNYRAPSLKSSALVASVWTFSGYGFSQILRLCSHLLLAWLLAPQVFGLMALVKVVLQGLNMFSDVGIAPSIIQSERGDEPKFLNTAWTIQVIRGIGLWICSCIISWPFAALFARNDPTAWQIRHLLPVAGFIAVLQGFNSTSLATLRRKLLLKHLTLLQIGIQLVSLTVMCTWALLSPTVWAMVAGGLAGGVFCLLVSHFIIPGYHVRFSWDHDCVDELVRFGKWIFLSTLFTFLAQNLDKVLLGNLLTLEELGLYSIAFVFAKVALHVSNRLGGTVLFPVYSKLKNEPERMVSVALRAREVVLSVGGAVCISFAVGSPLFFTTLWDTRYHLAGVIAQWLAVYIWAMIVGLAMDRIPLALGNSKAMFIANVWRTLGILTAIGGYMLAGLKGFIVGLSFGPVFAHLYLLGQVPHNRRAFVKQGLKFTLIIMAYGVPAVIVTVWVGNHAGMWYWTASVVVLAGLPPAVAAHMAWRHIRGGGRYQTQG